MNDLVRRLIEGGRASTHLVTLGGLGREGLAAALEAADIGLNEYARTLLGSPFFALSGAVRAVEAAVLAAEDLDEGRPMTLPDILRRGRELGLSPCPLELGPYFRLAYRDQEEEFEPGRNKAPRGSVTLVSEFPGGGDEDFPKGFYLRKIEGRLWLRGYVCPLDYVWEPYSKLAFVVSEA